MIFAEPVVVKENVAPFQFPSVPMEAVVIELIVLAATVGINIANTYIPIALPEAAIA
jgi:hypothetical protein